MTAKQALASWVGSLSEEEAAAWLARVHAETDGSQDAMARASRLRALFRRWEEEGPAMTDDQWAEFASSLDKNRHSYRPLFS